MKQKIDIKDGVVFVNGEQFPGKIDKNIDIYDLLYIKTDENGKIINVEKAKVFPDGSVSREQLGSIFEINSIF